MRKVTVTYYDDNHIYIERNYDPSVDLMEAFGELAMEITDKEDELNV